MSRVPDAPKRDLRKRKRTPDAGDADALARVLWECLQRARAIADDDNPDRVIRACHAVSTLAGTWAKVHELSDLAQRVDALEAAEGIRS
jgi:hypothetical protein